MANWSDPQPNATAFSPTDARTAAYDVGLRRYMLSVYNYMSSAVLLSGLVAFFFAMGGENSPAAQVFLGGGILKYVIMFAPLGFILAMNFGLSRMSDGTLQAVFWGFAVAMGLSLSTVFLRYTEASIAQSFFATAAAFTGLSLYGYTTKRDLSAFGTFLIMGVVGLIVAMLLNLWFQSSAFALAISLVGVLIFAGLTAYDTQRTKSMYAHVAGTGAEQRTAIMAATNLYLDFVNMFLFLLRIFGSSRN
ncbi:MAG: rane protein [Sphingomonas bacterium]|nr:rane protein [Sphingomonas bacterium]